MKDNFDFTQHHLTEQSPQVIGSEVHPGQNADASTPSTATAADDQKPKYDKGLDFFDAISNST